MKEHESSNSTSIRYYYWSYFTFIDTYIWCYLYSFQMMVAAQGWHSKDSITVSNLKNIYFSISLI